MIICPKCNGRATKLYSVSTGKYTCQQCNQEFDKEEYIFKIVKGTK